MRVSLGADDGLRAPWRSFNIDPTFTEPAPELCHDASCMMTGKLPSIDFSTWLTNNQSAVLTLALVLALAANVQRNR